IAEQVTDLDKWRNVLQETCLRGFKIHNISDRLTIYEHGWRNGNGAKEVQSNGQVEISLSGML
ncbi:MAG TPA: hypothetical protein VKA67_08970, partial [Verrucomicrobiae bacterium]|nr:hypothetical protein [Verrucomicrobiae bacterium]